VKTTELTNERVRELAERAISPESDTETITAFAGLLLAIANEENKERRIDLAHAALETAYRRGSEFGRVLYTFEQHAYATAGIPS
jgi:hypothetical protein